VAQWTTGPHACGRTRHSSEERVSSEIAAKFFMLRTSKQVTERETTVSELRLEK
jgi:hypothetical protein